ncbi:magnesium transporter CorA family protein [Candidatus Pacebacteria bacterium]|nr:magnesium transporter CorA family protein [Candidatus Paceibacterota bacterium]
MIERYVHDQLVWIDLLNPTTEEIREVVKECNLPLEFTSDLTTTTPRSEVLAKKGALKLTLDFPIVKRTDINHPHEVKFIATKKHFITIRFEDIEAIHRFSKEFEVSSLVKSAGKSASGAHVCLSLLDQMYRTMSMKLDYLESKMNDAEEQIFQGLEKEMVFEISNLSRRLVMFRQTLYAHDEALTELTDKVVVAFGKKYVPYVETLHQEYEHQVRRVGSLNDLLSDIRSTNDSLVSTKQNEIMKTLTIMAFITFPLTLFTSMFGMNTVTTPLVGQKGDFWLILGIMVVVSIAFFAYFKYKRWM